MADFFNFIYYPGIALFGNRPFFRVAAAEFLSQQLFKGITQVSLRAPAKALGKRHGNGVAAVDLTE